jgi:hypothetical protein
MAHASTLLRFRVAVTEKATGRPWWAPCSTSYGLQPLTGTLAVTATAPARTPRSPLGRPKTLGFPGGCNLLVSVMAERAPYDGLDCHSAHRQHAIVVRSMCVNVRQCAVNMQSESDVDLLWALEVRPIRMRRPFAALRCALDSTPVRQGFAPTRYPDTNVCRSTWCQCAAMCGNVQSHAHTCAYLSPSKPDCLFSAASG